MLEFAVPMNLDDMSDDPMDYERYARWLDVTSGEHGINEDTARLLMAYAKNKALSLERRLQGRIAVAQEIEARNDFIYQSLPEYYRWEHKE